MPVVDLSGDDILTPAARKQYKDRMASIEAELHQADLSNDPGRLELLSKEKQAIVKEIKAATGRGGRRRKFATDAENARKAVSRAINEALKRIAKDQPKLAEHLQARLRLGGKCCYGGDGIDWEV